MRITAASAGNIWSFRFRSAMTPIRSSSVVKTQSVSVIAQRITGYGIDTPPESGPSLEAYDRAFWGLGREDEAS